jgi:hypothetical protein
VQAGDEALDHQARAQIHVRQARDGGGMEIFAIEGLGWHIKMEINFLLQCSKKCVNL